jgi:hypothetical protein
MDDAALVYLGDAAWRGVDQMDVRQVERRQVFVVEGRPLAAIRPTSKNTMRSYSRWRNLFSLCLMRPASQ